MLGGHTYQCRRRRKNRHQQDGERRSGQIAQYPQSEARVYAPIAGCGIGVFEAFIAVRFLSAAPIGPCGSRTFMAEPGFEP
jgi:hypothetical protein